MENIDEKIKSPVSIASLMAKYQVMSAGPKQRELDDLLNYFSDKVRDRSGKPLAFARIVKTFKDRGMLKHFDDGALKLEDLYWLKTTCDRANNFAAMFWYLMKK